jgi:hypothetical protein
LRRSSLSIAALLVPVLTLAGCSAGSPGDFEDHFLSIDGVRGAWSQTTTSGSPFNKGLKVRLYLSDNPGPRVGQITDEVLRIAWTESEFEPTNGLMVQMEVNERPAEPRAADTAQLLSLRELSEAESIVLPGSFGSSGDTLHVDSHTLRERFGEWSG